MRLFAVILLFISISSIAQLNGGLIQSGDMQLRVNADGQLANTANGAASELPISSGNHLFKFINIWLSARDAGNNLYISSVNGYKNISDYSSGPLDSLTFKGADPEEWNTTYMVSASEIKNHRQNFRNSDYNLPNTIKTWPANGKDRFNKYLAPFIDYDGNGVYEPMMGDYPDIKGDKCIYFIANDNFSEHKASGGQPLKVEIYGFAYALDNTPNTIFLKYYIINRTKVNLSQVKIAYHAGFQLGNPSDNYCGTLVGQNAIFAYNGDTDDENHYGKSQPIAALISLNKPIESSVYIDNSTDTNCGMPQFPYEHQNMMEGKWKSGSAITFGGNGIGQGSVSKFVYPGPTDPKFGNQNWVENGTPGERSLLAGLNANNLSAKGFVELDFAVTGFQSSTGSPYAFLDQTIKSIKSNWLMSGGLSVKPMNKADFVIKCPALVGDNLFEPWFRNFSEIRVINQHGQLVKTMNPNVDNTLILNNSGIYYISFLSDNQIYTKKLLII